MPNEMKKKQADFPHALRSFLGHLEGTSKAEHTIKNYRLDILAFHDFLAAGLSDRPVPLDQITPRDLDRFHDHLVGQGLKTNTRRRKLLTVRRFLGYLVNRKKLPVELGRKIPTPHKVERVPFVVPSTQLLVAIRKLGQETLLDERNRVLLWVLAETGAQVSEAAALRYEDWDIPAGPGGQPLLRIGGKTPRAVPVSRELREAVEALQARSGGKPWLFLGFNKFGSLGGAISPRGVELLVKFHAPKLGYPGLTPRTFRHSAVLQWFQEGCSREEIQRRLGLKTAYAFRSYEPLFKSRS